MISETIKIILSEIGNVLAKTNEAQVIELVRELIKAKKIVAIGAGRVGLAVKAFTMRLGHLGCCAFMLGDATVPSIGKEDLLLVCSGSGETQTIYDIVEIARSNKAKIALITANCKSRMGKLSDTIVEIKAPSKCKQVSGFKSVQPMTTLNEQCLGIFLDAVVLCLMVKLNENHESMWARHSNLE